MPRRKRDAYPQEHAEGGEDQAFAEVLSAEAPPAEEAEVPVPSSADPPDFRSVEDYLKRQVYLERYGTDEPTAYEKTLQALKRLL